MYPLIESIKIDDGRFYNLEWHQKRVDRAFASLSNEALSHDLSMIDIPKEFEHGLVKCRFAYSSKSYAVTFQAYSIRDIKTLQIVEDDAVTYEHKFTDRKVLDNMYAGRGDKDEIMIIKNGLVTDAYYYNFVFQKDNRFFTPAKPLLLGTMRASLIDKQTLIPTDIAVKDIQDFECVHLINAMTPLHKIVVLPHQIYASH